MTLWETNWEDDRATTQIYSNYYYYNLPFFENSIVLRNDGYQINTTFLNDYRLSANIQNTTEKTNVQLTHYIEGFQEFRPFVSFSMEMNESVTEKYKVKLRKDFGRGLEKIIDGWFFDHLGATGYVKRVVNQLVPSHLNKYLITDINGYFESLQRSGKRLSRFIGRKLRYLPNYLDYLDDYLDD